MIIAKRTGFILRLQEFSLKRPSVIVNAAFDLLKSHEMLNTISWMGQIT